MPELIADSLVVLLPPQASLRSWCECGVAEREWMLLREMLPHYRRVVLISHDEAGKDALATALPGGEALDRVHVISNTANVSAARFADGLPAALGHLLRQDSTAVLRTVEMTHGDIAARLADELRAEGKRVGLIARGGHLWTRFVAFEHGPNSYHAGAAAGAEMALCRAADIVVGTTRAMVDDLAWRYQLDPARCAVVPNFVLDDQPPAAGGDRDTGLILTAGPLISRKRTNLLIEAMALLPEALRSRSVLEIIGDGPQKASLEALAARLNAPVRFRAFLPYRKTLARMRECGVYVQSSAIEGHPTAVIEAMATGAAVLVARSPGLENVVTHGMNGLRLESTAQAFATAIEQVLADAEWREVMGSAAARTARAEYALPLVVEKSLASQRAAIASGSLRAAWRTSA